MKSRKSCPKSPLRLQELLSFKNDEHPCGLLSDLEIGAALLHATSGETGFSVGNRLLRLKERLEMELSRGNNPILEHPKCGKCCGAGGYRAGFRGRITCPRCKGSGKEPVG